MIYSLPHLQLRLDTTGHPWIHGPLKTATSLKTSPDHHWTTRLHRTTPSRDEEQILSEVCKSPLTQPLDLFISVFEYRLVLTFAVRG